MAGNSECVYFRSYANADRKIVMWLYVQHNGKLYRDGHLIGTGYAGYPPHVNRPDDQCLIKLGPLPRGFYTIGPAYSHPKLGPVCMDLTPDASNEMCERSLFRIHADSILSPGNASEGCVVQNHSVRIQVEMSGDKRLQVVAEDPESE